MTRDQGSQVIDITDLMRSLSWAVYAPTFLVSICLNGITILLPLYVLQLGGSAGFAAIVIGLRGVGSMLAGVPAGLAVTRFGDTQVATAGLVGVIGTVLAMALSDSAWLLAPLGFLFGLCTGMWQLGRLNYMTMVTTTDQRGRAISVMAGLQRCGFLIGPALGGFIAQFLGFKIFFIVCAALYAGAMVLMVRFARAGTGSVQSQSAATRLLTTARETRGILLRAGPAVICLQMLRAARTLILPLWAAAIGLSPSQIGVAFSIASIVDIAMFYPAGWMIDYWGRRVVLAPALILMGVACAGVSLAGSFAGFVLVSVIGGLGNGFSTGIAMTLGGDFSPPHRRGEFLGLWRLVGDAGTASGPFVISALVGTVGLAGAGVSIGVIGIAGLAFVLVMPETRARR